MVLNLSRSSFNLSQLVSSSLRVNFAMARYHFSIAICAGAHTGTNERCSKTRAFQASKQIQREKKATEELIFVTDIRECRFMIRSTP